MESLVFNILFIWCITESLIINNSTVVKFENSPEQKNQRKSKMTCFEEYYWKMSRNGPGRTVLEQNEVLGLELCLILAHTYGKTLYNDTEKKNCTIEFQSMYVKTQQFNFVFIRLGKCICTGHHSFDPLYIREYAVDNDISQYFIFSLVEGKVELHSMVEYLQIDGVLDTFNGIIYKNFLPIKSQTSKFLMKENIEKKEETSKTINGSKVHTNKSTKNKFTV